MADRRGDSGDLEERTERWFIRRGLPHFIYDYSITGDVLTRAVPFLAFVFVVEVVAVFQPERQGWREAAAVAGGVLILFGAVVGLNKLRGRRALQLPDRVGLPEVLVFLLVPPLLPALFSEDRLIETPAFFGVNLLILGLAYVVTSYGLLPMTRWAGGRMVRQLGGIANLVARSLPLLLLFSVFLFLNAEIWQVAADFSQAFFWIVLGLLFGIGVLFLLLRIPKELEAISRFDSWAEATRLADGTPMAGVDPQALADPPDPPPLGRRSWLNVGLVMLVSHGVQIFLVAVVVGLFYTVFGLFTVREATIVQWTTQETISPLVEVELFGEPVVLTGELLRVAGFIAAFSGLYFTVAAITDATYREEFYEENVGEVREALAVRALYIETVVEAA